MGSFSRLKRYLIELNLFETIDADEGTIYAQRWSTRIYICVLLLSMTSFLVQHGLSVKTELIEVKNPSLESHYKLQKRYPDVKCPCSQISASYGSFVTLIPIYHPICSSGFISQAWIEMLVDNMTAFRFFGDFRATASTQFQVLRELCRFSRATFNTSIESLLKREFISSAVLSEERWRDEIQIEIDSVHDTTLLNVQQRISFLQSFIIYSFFGSGIQTSFTVELYGMPDQAAIWVSPIYYSAEYMQLCACDDSGFCHSPSSFYNVSMVDGVTIIYSHIPSLEAVSDVNNWLTGCWALTSVLQSSFNDSFISNQAALNEIATHFNWSSQSNIPISLNLTESNLKTGSTRTFNDLLQAGFLLNTVVRRNYSSYFEQCRPASCFYSRKQYSSFLHIFTSLLSLYGGLSVVLRFIIPNLVTIWVKRFMHRFRISVSKYW